MTAVDKMTDWELVMELDRLGVKLSNFIRDIAIDIVKLLTKSNVETVPSSPIPEVKSETKPPAKSKPKKLEEDKE